MDEERELLLNERNEECQRKSRNIVKNMLPRKLKEYWRTFILAVTMLLSGIAFVIVAIYIITLPDYSTNAPHCYIFLLCATMCIIPGGYHVGYMFLAYTGREGYKLRELPRFADD